MRQLIAVLIAFAGVVPGFATTDPDLDQLGVYFDLNADVTCISVPAGTYFNAYVVITNLQAAAVDGVEFHYHLAVPAGAESMIQRWNETWPPGTLLIGSNELLDDDVVVGFATPLPGNGASVTVLTWNYLLLDAISVDFYLGPVPVQALEDGLPGYVAGGVVYPLGVSSGDPSLPVASVNGECNVVSVESAPFGAVRCLYR